MWMQHHLGLERKSCNKALEGRALLKVGPSGRKSVIWYFKSFCLLNLIYLFNWIIPSSRVKKLTGLLPEDKSWARDLTVTSYDEQGDNESEILIETSDFTNQRWHWVTLCDTEWHWVTLCDTVWHWVTLSDICDKYDTKVVSESEIFHWNFRFYISQLVTFTIMIPLQSLSTTLIRLVPRVTLVTLFDAELCVTLMICVICDTSLFFKFVLRLPRYLIFVKKDITRVTYW